MEVTRIKNYINGEWVKPSGTEVRDVENPATGEVLAQFHTSTREDVKEAAEKAKDAFKEWRKKTGRNWPEPLLWNMGRNTLPLTAK